jgi:hypothetical protein
MGAQSTQTGPKVLVQPTHHWISFLADVDSEGLHGVPRVQTSNKLQGGVGTVVWLRSGA